MALTFCVRSIAAEPIVELGVTYCVVDGRPLKLDIARPSDAAGPQPLVVCIHGGGWHKGRRTGWRKRVMSLAEAGYVAATIDYRLAPAYKWPAQIEDAKAAVRFLRAHAKDYGIDASRVAALGDSAGGHLSLLLGLTDEDDFRVGEYFDQPAKVQAVVNYYGGMDFRTWKVGAMGRAALVAGFNGRDLDELLESFTGTSDRTDPRMAAASPATYADAGDPPIITFQGTADILVPVSEARQFDAAMKKAGVDHELVLIEGANHGWRGERTERTDRLAMEFLNKTLRK